jgi:hypothetical protein
MISSEEVQPAISSPAGGGQTDGKVEATDACGEAACFADESRQMQSLNLFLHGLAWAIAVGKPQLSRMGDGFALVAPPNRQTRTGVQWLQTTWGLANPCYAPLRCRYPASRRWEE